MSIERSEERSAPGVERMTGEGDGGVSIERMTGDDDFRESVVSAGLQSDDFPEIARWQ